MTVPAPDARSPALTPAPPARRILAARPIFIFAIAVMVALVAASLRANARRDRPDVAIDARDGLLTATFSDRTTDSELAAAVPGLIAQGVLSIRLQGAPVRSVAPLAAMAALRQLDVAGTQVRDLAPLTALKNLSAVNLQFLRISDLRPLSELKALRGVNAGGTDVSDLAPLTGLSALRDLSLAVTPVSNLRPLARLRELAALDLGGTRVSDLGPLADLSNLRVLGLNGALVDDIRPLSGLKGLRTLDLAGTMVTDLAPLAGLTALRSLDLEGTPVADIAPLAGLPVLRSVALGGSRVTDLTPLGGKTVDPRIALTKPGPQDPVLFWNDQTNRAIQATMTDAFMASRALALESIAVLDTLDSIRATPAFLVRLPAPPDAAPAVAAAAAAHAMLCLLFPGQQAALDAAFAAYLSHDADSIARQRSIAFGDAMAQAVFMRQAEDGSAGNVPRPAGHASGQWRPTPPDYLEPSHTEWATMRPFVLTGPGQFRPPGPPAPDSAAFHDAKAVVAAVGARRSSARTDQQTQIARYWSDAIGSYAPSGHWNAIAASIMAPLHLGLDTEARYFAELNVALADAGVAVADAKYAYWFWRPVTAIRAGDSADPPDPAWVPLLETPNHPSYISGHSAFSAAAAAVLTVRLGDRAFTFASDSLPGVTRSFSGFRQAAEEAAASRLYGGIHYPFDNADGLATGRAVGERVVSAFDRRPRDRGPFLMVETEPGSRAVIGCALDNLAPVAMVQARLDGGAPMTLMVDDKGWFAVPPQPLAPDRPHAIVVAATSQSGMTSTARMDIDHASDRP